MLWPNRQHEQAERPAFSLLSITVLLGVMMAFGLTMISFIMQESKTSQHYQKSIAAANLAEAGLQKAMFCLNADDGSSCNGQFGQYYTGENNIQMDQGSFSITVSGTGDTRTITAVGTTNTGHFTKVRKRVTLIPPTYTETQIDYSVLITDFISLSNGTIINGGPLHSAVDVVCANNTEMNVDVYVSKAGGKIDNCDIVGDAHADRIVNSTETTGHCYWGTELADSVDCGTGDTGGQPTPSARPLPFFDVDHWQTQSLVGGIINGDYDASENERLGPKKIEGKLYLDNNIDVVMEGPLWITGDLEMKNGSTITLDPSIGNKSSVILVDGQILIENGSELYGTGQPGSFILAVSTLDSDEAIEIANNAEGAIFFAINGGVVLLNNGGAAAVVGEYLNIANEAYISYDELLGNGNLDLQSTTGDEEWIWVDDTWTEGQ